MKPKPNTLAATERDDSRVHFIAFLPSLVHCSRTRDRSSRRPLIMRWRRGEDGKLESHWGCEDQFRDETRRGRNPSPNFFLCHASWDAHSDNHRNNDREIHRSFNNKFQRALIASLYGPGRGAFSGTAKSFAPERLFSRAGGASKQFGEI
jgi:hypothetical protein